jgi:hypothetical protein
VENGPKHLPLRLSIHLGQAVPSKKNRHYAGANGRILMDKKIKQRMLAIENAIVSALRSAWQTTVCGTSMECPLPSWIASSLPEDDCWEVIPDVHSVADKSEEWTVVIDITPLE